jgi:hypothetical protein
MAIIGIEQNRVYCAKHPFFSAEWVCTKCQSGFCGQCVKTVEARGEHAHVCPDCGGFCRMADASEQGIPPEPLRVEMFSAFRFPLQGDGKILLLIGAFLLWVSGFALGSVGAVRDPFVKFVLGILGRMCIGGYFAAFFLSVISKSAHGEDKPPDWPGFSTFFESIFIPVFQVCGTVLFALGPAIAYYNWFGSDPLYYLLLFAGMIYLPMSLLAMALFESFSALNPVLILNSIAKCMPEYLGVAFTLCLVAGTRILSDKLLGGVIIVGGLGCTFVGLYLLIVTGRLIGLLYRRHEKKLNWFALEDV